LVPTLLSEKCIEGVVVGLAYNRMVDMESAQRFNILSKKLVFLRSGFRASLGHSLVCKLVGLYD